MALTLAEGLVNAIKTYVEANLAAKLTALNVEYADSITLANTVATYKGIKSLLSVQDYPALYIISANEGMRVLAVSSGASLEAKPAMEVGVLVLDQNAETLQLRLYRYGRALTELMLDAMGAGQLANWSLATDEEWRVDTESGPLVEGIQDSPFIGVASLSIRANKIETM